jgi:hypothetical protein
MKGERKMNESIDLSKLREPFFAEDIEWRIGRATMTQRGPRATVLAYLTARAVMDRLDNVVGPGNWCDSYSYEGDNYLCSLSLCLNGAWITKMDGGVSSNFEAFKGGLSDAFKRAAVKWGVGRYLYGLSETWVEIFEHRQEGAHYVNSKDSKGNLIKGFWLPPSLPSWALPKTKTK